MAVPIIELITANLVSALSSVSVEGGYGTTLLVKEPDHVADAAGDGVCIVDEGDWTYEDPGWTGRDSIFQEYSVLIYIRGGNEFNFKKLGRQYANDAKKAIMLDQSRGGYARWTKVTGSRYFTDGALRGIIVSAQVYYRTIVDLPDQQG